MRHLPLHDIFVEKHATFIPFTFWEVPAYFTSILEEHKCVREHAGIFDISHMGIFSIEGKDAEQYLQYLTTNDIASIGNMKALYTPICNEAGGIIDDIFVYKKTSTSFMCIVNAANCEKDFNWFSAHKKTYEIVLANISEQKAMFALQGPHSCEIVNDAWNFDLGDIPYHSFIESHINGCDLMIATTGYTGELGCEIVCPYEHARVVWDQLVAAGSSYELSPIGFGARDTLRLEAACLLYGQDMDETTTPLESALSWTVKFDKKDFIGKNALIQQKERGVQKKIVGFEMIDRGIPRHEYNIMKNDMIMGKVTSGSFCPTVNKNIGLGYVDVAHADIGTEIDIQVRDRLLKARVVRRPFYRRNK